MSPKRLAKVNCKKHLLLSNGYGCRSNTLARRICTMHVNRNRRFDKSHKIIAPIRNPKHTYIGDPTLTCTSPPLMRTTVCTKYIMHIIRVRGFIVAQATTPFHRDRSHLSLYMTIVYVHNGRRKRLVTPARLMPAVDGT